MQSLKVKILSLYWQSLTYIIARVNLRIPEFVTPWIMPQGKSQHVNTNINKGHFNSLPQGNTVFNNETRTKRDWLYSLKFLFFYLQQLHQHFKVMFKYQQKKIMSDTLDKTQNRETVESYLWHINRKTSWYFRTRFPNSHAKEQLYRLLSWNLFGLLCTITGFSTVYR